MAFPATAPVSPHTIKVMPLAFAHLAEYSTTTRATYEALSGWDLPKRSSSIYRGKAMRRTAESSAPAFCRFSLPAKSQSWENFVLRQQLVVFWSLGQALVP